MGHTGRCQGCRAPRSSGFVFPLPEDALGESLQFALGFSAARRAHGAFGEDISGWQPAALSSPQPQEREGTGLRSCKMFCQRRSRDFHAFCVHSFWAGSGFVFQNLLVTLSYCTLPLSFVGFAFFSLQAGFSGLVWGSPLPTLCSCSQLPWAVWMQQSSGCSELTPEEGMPLPLNMCSRTNGKWEKSLHSHGCSMNPNQGTPRTVPGTCQG